MKVDTVRLGQIAAVSSSDSGAPARVPRLAFAGSTPTRYHREQLKWPCVDEGQRRFPGPRCLCALLLLLAFTANSPTYATPSTGDPIPIAAGQILSRTQDADEVISYAFEADRGENYLIEVDQHGQQSLDFIVSVTDPGGENHTFNSPLLRNESEFVLLEDAAAVTYLISVSSAESTHAPGSHTILITPLSVHDGDDSHTFEAWRALADGTSADADGRLVDAESALEHFETAAELWQRLDNSRLEAFARYSVLMIEYLEFSNWRRVVESGPVVAGMYQALNEPELYATVTSITAECLDWHARAQGGTEANASFERALDLFDVAYDVHEQLGNVYSLALIKNDKGLAYFHLGDFSEASTLWQEAVPMFSGLGEWRHESNTRMNLAVIDYDEGYNARAAATYENILELIPANEDPDLRAIVLENLADAYRAMGRIDDALVAGAGALDIYQSIEDSFGVAYAFRGLGSSYFALGELERASHYLNQALRMAVETNNGRTQARILAKLGSIAFLSEDFATALRRHSDSLELTTSDADRAIREVLVANDLAALGRYADSIASAESALDAARQARSVVSEADALRAIGSANLKRGMPLQAIEYLENALHHYESLGLHNGQANVFNSLALAARAVGDFESAASFGEESIRYSESLRARVAVPALRATYSSTRREAYEAQIDLLMTRHQMAGTRGTEHLQAALSISERARARMTVDLMAEASLNLQSSTNAGELARRRELIGELVSLQGRTYQHSNTESNSDELNNLANEMALIETELDLLETELRRNNPQYASLTSPPILSAAAIQDLLTPDTVLLQYALGEDRSFAWMVTDQSIAGIELAPREMIEAAARAAFESLKTYRFDASGRGTVEGNLRTLSDLILTPLVSLLDDQRRHVLVSADGALQYIPFGILPVESGGVTERLVMSRQITNVGSMSAVAAQQSRTDRDAPGRLLAIFADPVFESADPRFVKSEHNVAAAGPVSLDLLTRTSVGTSLVRLPASGREARAIASLVPEDDRLVASGFDANRSTLLGTDLSDFRYLHFATHGLIDSRYPALSALALSSLDEDGSAQEGMLRLHDIYNLELNADLVVLSACETALGREIRGEGLVGLAQGFLYAGASSLIVSLWQVPDAATAELMTRFYEFMLDGQRSPAEALSLAQRSIAGELRWRDPYFWGAFITLGRPEFSSRASPDVLASPDGGAATATMRADIQ